MECNIADQAKNEYQPYSTDVNPSSNKIAYSWWFFIRGNQQSLSQPIYNKEQNMGLYIWFLFISTSDPVYNKRAMKVK